MSPIALALNILLAGLLVLALWVGVRLNSRLKALRASHAGFEKAVAELNEAAARAEAGLEALRATTDEAKDGLLSRIETARTLAVRLERATQDAERAANRVAQAKIDPPSQDPLGQAAGRSKALAAIAALVGDSPQPASLATNAPTAKRMPAPVSAPGSAPTGRRSRFAFDEDLFEGGEIGPTSGTAEGRSLSSPRETKVTRR